MISGLQEALEVIRRGGIVGLPTDTVYGIGVDPTDDEAVAALYQLKGRPEARPIGVLAASFDQASMIGEITGQGAELAARHWPGALTLVVRPRVILADWVGDRHAATVGVRVPDHPVAIELLALSGPLAVTSANRSGAAETTTADQARAVFGDTVYYLAGTSPGGEPSTVVDVTGDHPILIRQGPVVVDGR